MNVYSTQRGRHWCGASPPMKMILVGWFVDVHTRAQNQPKRIQNPTITPKPALQKALSAPETADGEGAAISSESCLKLSCTNCTVLFENKTTLFAVYRKKAELFSTPQLIIKCTHMELLAGPSFNEGLSFWCFRPPI